jgi:hypothetical protein
MAKIPMGDFGQVRAQVAPTHTPSAHEQDAGLGNALQGLGQTGMNIAGAQLAKDRQAEADIVATADANNARTLREQEAAAKREADKQAARAEQIQHLTATADIQNGLADSLEEISVRVARGDTKKDDARKEFAAASEKVVAASLVNLPPDLAPLVEAQMRGLRGHLNNKLEDGIRKRDNQEADAGLIKYGEQMQRLAQTDPALAIKQHSGAVQALGPAAGWTPEQIAKTDQAFKEKVLYTNSLAVVHAARGNIKALDQAGNMINGRGDLDPGAKERLLNQVELQKNQIEEKALKRADIAARQYENTLKKAEAALGGAIKLSDYGTLDESAAGKAMAATAGTPYQAQVKAMLENQRTTGPLTRQQPQAVRGAIDALNADMTANGVNETKRARLDQLKKVQSGQEHDLKEDPLKAFTTRYADKPVAPLDFTDITKLTTGLQERRQVADMAKSWSGKDTAPLFAHEIEPVRKLLGNLSGTAKENAISMLATVSGPSGSKALATALDEKDRTMALAFAAASRGTPEGRAIVGKIFKGQQAVVDKTVMKDDKAISGWRATVAKELNGLLPNPQNTSQVQDVAELLIAARAAENGGSAGSSDIRKAMEQALGGKIVDQGDGRIVIPAGMNQRQLIERFKTMTRKDLIDQVPTGMVKVAGQDIYVEDFIKSLPGATLKTVGPGKYNVLVPRVPGGEPDALVTNHEDIPMKVGF